MPVEDKKKDPMVDVGEVEGADVELESKENTEALASAEKEEPTKVEESVKEERTVEAKKEEPKEIEKEAEEYSEGVQRRIAKLTKKWREAERQKEEALRYAQIVRSEKENMSKKFSALETTSVKDREAKIVAALEAAKSKLGLAREAGDISAEIDISKEIAKLGYEEARLSELKSQAALLPKEQSQIKDIPVMQQQASAVPENIPTDGKAESWAANNRWFGTDKAMTYTAFDIHRQIVDEEGYDPKSDEYYTEIDKRIRLEFPHKFATTASQTTTAKPIQNVASATRSGKNSNRKIVRLTPSQVAIAKKLGVPLEEYAKQLNITKEV
jgi:hypothetical protein